MKFNLSFLFFAIAFYLVSCTTQKNSANYVQDVLRDTSGKDVVIPELRIQKNDILSIQVFSISTKPELSDALYNLPAPANTGNSSGQGGGFLVDAKGNIEYPRLGTFHVEGLTKEELANEIKKRLTEPEEKLTNPTVLIRFQSFKVTVIGEVNSQGVITIPGERVTILEAVGLAGGITEYGIKDAVKVIRESDGRREIGMIDLSSKDMFESPYYNLRQNDVVLIDPTPRKAKKADQDIVIQRVGFGLSLITAIALLYNIFK